jgi:hypothetical protein
MEIKKAMPLLPPPPPPPSSLLAVYIHHPLEQQASEKEELQHARIYHFSCSSLCVCVGLADTIPPSMISITVKFFLSLNLI